MTFPVSVEVPLAVTVLVAKYGESVASVIVGGVASKSQFKLCPLSVEFVWAIAAPPDASESITST